ncbi:MAG: polysaccharide deacetylase family protein [Alphaproteobacteria bacterium]|nr:polysaccharide deacetylase family protein [Alphaproteobacteria bacterium]
MPPSEAAKTCGWADLVEELDRWAATGNIATFWWRDDDAVRPTASLADMLRLAAGTPIGLAVIPALAQPELAAALPSTVTVLQHGWRHVNHAVAGKKSEYPPGRSPVLVAAEIGAGMALQRSQFGTRALPIFVPPWNRIAAEFLPLLRALGLTKVSGMTSRQVLPGTVSSVILDVHVDLTAWRQDRGFVGTEPALGEIVRRLGAARQAQHYGEPLGILTHHLIMDDLTRGFLDRLLSVTRRHPGVLWAAPTELMA